MFTKVLEYQKEIIKGKSNLSKKEKKLLNRQMLEPFIEL